MYKKKSRNLTIISVGAALEKLNNCRRKRAKKKKTRENFKPVGLFFFLLSFNRLLPKKFLWLLLLLFSFLFVSISRTRCKGGGAKGKYRMKKKKKTVQNSTYRGPATCTNTQRFCAFGRWRSGHRSSQCTALRPWPWDRQEWGKDTQTNAAIYYAEPMTLMVAGHQTLHFGSTTGFVFLLRTVDFVHVNVITTLIV